MVSTRYDALLLLSFGGPEGVDDVIPFLRNVTAGRGIPDERLKVVGEHYYHFDGVSPLNAQNRELVTLIEAELAHRGIDLPVYLGNRNWHPFAAETADRIADDGHRRVLVFATSAWGGYSGCLQYNEDIRGLIDQHPELSFSKLRQFYSHPKFIAEFADSLQRAWEEVPVQRRESTRVLFTAHSIPTSADAKSGGDGDKHLYSRQVAEAARLVAEKAGVEDYDLVYQSRSGAPHVPWLEPDVVDHTTALAERGVTDVVVCPVGFITDHIEVLWDLDTDLVTAADELGVQVHRVATPGLTERFADMVVDLIIEHTTNAPLVGQSSVSVQGCTDNGLPCADGCCSRL
ncbi:ferrochelatase [Corynebacterium uterequi]|uniref:Coproporphyrin III ferrochelatase n=1 Tax=Corynebacterium uterequi TaxID=1072256 RepID=A0A0G3HCP7_9CORY|nr:ferrochelatase [Corynebacterium uterequi]AKK11111.1 ferrochelatase [Corynebacterium uterequi]